VGPTKEFFAILFREIQRFHLKLWQGEVNSGLEDAAVACVHCANGLFPLAIPYKYKISRITPSQFDDFQFFRQSARQMCYGFKTGV
jgi:hypothetical protein